MRQQEYTSRRSDKTLITYLYFAVLSLEIVKSTTVYVRISHTGKTHRGYRVS